MRPYREFRLQTFVVGLLVLTCLLSERNANATPLVPTSFQSLGVFTKLGVDEYIFGIENNKNVPTLFDKDGNSLFKGIYQSIDGIKIAVFTFDSFDLKKGVKIDNRDLKLGNISSLFEPVAFLSLTTVNIDGQIILNGIDGKSGGTVRPGDKAPKDIAQGGDPSAGGSNGGTGGSTSD